MPKLGIYELTPSGFCQGNPKVAGVYITSYNGRDHIYAKWDGLEWKEPYATKALTGLPVHPAFSAKNWWLPILSGSTKSKLLLLADKPK